MPTLKDLRTQAKAKGVKGYSKMKKADLESALAVGAPHVVTKAPVADLRDLVRLGVARDVMVIGDCTLILGDCREILPSLGKVDAVVTDPPYGIGLNTNSQRFTGGVRTSGKSRIGTNYGSSIVGDDRPFDAQFLTELAPEVIVWGWNNFPTSLPRGTALIWIKTADAGFGTFLSDAEVAWQKGGHGVYCFRDLTNKAEAAWRVHPTQKPLPLMRWCVARASDEGHTILDPFMGSGTTGVACVKLGRKFIGIEIEPRYYEIASKRISDAYRQPDFFVPTSFPKPQQLSLIAAE